MQKLSEKKKFSPLIDILKIEIKGTNLQGESIEELEER
jgi:hypothetical protein